MDYQSEKINIRIEEQYLEFKSKIFKKFSNFLLGTKQFFDSSKEVSQILNLLFVLMLR